MYKYNITDHLGNVRAEITPYIGAPPLVTQARNYYTFGMEMSQLNNNGSYNNKYLYNGKEIQDDFGLYWYDYGARFYDPMVGRWHTQDPKAEKYYNSSPYSYVENNPLLHIDPNGMDKLRFALNFKLTTGKIGVKGKLFGVKVGGGYAKGAAEQELKVYLDIDTDNWGVKAGGSTTQRIIEEEISVNFGVVHSTESSEKESTQDLNTKDGYSETDEKVYKDKESGGIGPVTFEETKEGTQVKSDLGTGVEVNALIMGVGAGLDVEYTKTDPKNENEKNQKNQ